MDSKLEMKQPYKILTDIWGVITSWNFSYCLKSYVENNLQNYLTENWSELCLKEFVQQLREQTIKDRQNDIDLPLILEESEQNSTEVVIQSVVDNIKYRQRDQSLDSDLQPLYDSMWTDGYTSGDLITHAFEDVKPALQKWTSHDSDGQLDSIKVYTYASGLPASQKLFLSSTVCGDLSQHIVCGINSFYKYKTDPNKYKAVISSLLERTPKNILYLTDRPNRAKAALQAGMRAVIVLRSGNTQYSEQELTGFLTITSFEDLEFLP